MRLMSTYVYVDVYVYATPNYLLRRLSESQKEETIW